MSRGAKYVRDQNVNPLCRAHGDSERLLYLALDGGSRSIMLDGKVVDDIVGG